MRRCSDSRGFCEHDAGTCCRSLPRCNLVCAGVSCGRQPLPAFANRLRELVRVERLELPRLAAPEPKSGVSTNFTIPAPQNRVENPLAEAFRSARLYNNRFFPTQRKNDRMLGIGPASFKQIGTMPAAAAAHYSRFTNKRPLECLNRAGKPCARRMACMLILHCTNPADCV